MRSNLIKYSNSKLNQQQQGFTLIEVIIGIVTLSVAFAVIINLILPATEQSAGQIQQIRAAELGQSLMNEIVAKAFDDNSDMVGGLVRCGESGVNCSTTMGAEGENRDQYDDVDDYNGLTLVQNSLAEDLGTLYQGFKVSIIVCNDSNYDGTCNASDDNKTAKLITITITDSLDNSITFATYRANF